MMSSTFTLEPLYLQIFTTAEMAFSVALMFSGCLDSGCSITLTRRGIHSVGGTKQQACNMVAFSGALMFSSSLDSESWTPHIQSC